MSFRSWLALFVGTILMLSCSETKTMDRTHVSSENDPLVPRHLLALLHASEVQQELKLSDGQVTKLESLFAEVDGTWFRSRLQPALDQLKTMRDLEDRVHGWLRENLNAEQTRRLWQLECQAQSIRMMCRTDVARQLQLTAEQQQKFAALARETEAIRVKLQQALREGPSEEAKAKLEHSLKAEQEALKSVLTAAQQQRVWDVLGEPFATNKLERVHPMAPEFLPVKHWVNSPPVTLNSLRGKVVLVHFYAYQCHNCHANFPIYKRWQEQLGDKGVVVIGIQTPETSNERDVSLVRQAASERGLEFPILVDLESANWQAWGNTMWPTVYVVDKRGYLRYWWQGELNWQGATGDKIVEQLVDRLLVE